MASERTGIITALTGLCLLAVAADAQDLGGIALGQPIPPELPAPAGTEVQGPFAYALWRLEDGTSMSVTTRTDTGDVLYVEMWRTETSGTIPTALDRIVFGDTTLDDLVGLFGSGGIVFEARGRSAPAGANAAFFTSYEIDGTGAVLSFVTLLPLEDARPETAPASVLDAVILGQGAYLDAIWGPNRGRLEGYAPIPDPTQ